MLKIAHILASLIGVSETLILATSLTVAAIWLFTRRLRKRAKWARTLGRLLAFGPLTVACVLVLDGWHWNSGTIELLQRTGSLSEEQATTFWQETYVGSGKTFAYGLLVTLVFVLLQRSQLANGRYSADQQTSSKALVTSLDP